MPHAHLLIQIAGFTSLSVAASYSAVSVIASLVWRSSRHAPDSTSLRPVTLLKPLCGWEPGLYEHLRSFCEQTHPQFQIIFGVRELADPACRVVERLAREFPSLPIKLVVNPQLHGSNCKISNLMNMIPFAKHDVLVMSDSDAFVGSDYLVRVTSPLSDPTVGLVSCIYRGAPTAGIWSRLGAMYINEWYVPSILLAWLFGYDGYVSGQTICLTRETLRRIGGLDALKNHLADDYRLGELVRNLGLRIELSRYVVRGEHHEPSLQAVISHERRWMRTLRVLKPRSFRGLFLTFSVPVALLGLMLLSNDLSHSPIVRALFGFTVLARLVLHLSHRLDAESRTWFADLWLLPIRDLLLCWVWCLTFLTSRVTWRGNEFDVDGNGVMRRLSR